MKKSLIAISIYMLVAVHGSRSQSYCTFTVDVANSAGSGISAVTLNSSPSINRTSVATEGLVNTGSSGTVIKGNSYNFSITVSTGGFCNLYNIRVWIDYNDDYDFDDAGEEAVSLSSIGGGTTNNASFTVPTSAAMATVRMRVGAKMTESCGHTAPTPCNNPPDGLGWHGEVEDYSLSIQQVVGMDLPGNFLSPAIIQLSYRQNEANIKAIVDEPGFTGKMVIRNILGIKMKEILITTGENRVSAEHLLPGVYICTIETNEGKILKAGKIVF